MSHTIPTNDKLKPFSPAGSGSLFLVATPIGNLKDITYRAIETLNSADLIACEDTRVTKKLLNHYGINTKCIVYNDHSKQKNRDQLLAELAHGRNIALVSDAGTPMISDPGYKLVADAVAKGIKVESIPGPCAAISALTVSGLPSDSFHFYGFFKSKSALEDLKHLNSSLVFYESPRRLIKTLQAMMEVFGDRRAAVSRELTKMFEETARNSLSELIAFYEAHENLKGELVIVVEGAKKSELDQAQIEALLIELMATMSVKDATAEIVANYGITKNKVYDLALKIKNQR